MRIFTVALLAGSAFIAANSFTSDGQSAKQEEKQASMEVPAGVDPIVTGQTISPENIADWERQNRAYIDCPDCEATQPFPGD